MWRLRHWSTHLLTCSAVGDRHNSRYVASWAGTRSVDYADKHMLLKAKAKTLGDTLTDMKVEALVDTLAHTLREPVNRRHCEILGDVTLLVTS